MGLQSPANKAKPFVVLEEWVEFEALISGAMGIPAVLVCQHKPAEEEVHSAAEGEGNVQHFGGSDTWGNDRQGENKMKK